MKKFFTFFAAMLFALTAWAGNVWNVTNSSEGNLRRCLRDNAQAGDTIVLTSNGEYQEDQSYNVRKNVVIMAAEGVRPVIKQKSYLNLYASAQIIGIKFKYVGTSDGYCIYFRENSPKYLALEGCEFQGFTNYAFTSWENFHIDSCIVNNCYFHDLSKGAFYFPKSTLANDTNACDKLKVTNCTFANITLNEVAVLDLRNNNNNSKSTSELLVDHCTFYKCKGYERMIQTYKTPNGTVSNCIMMNPLDADTVSPIYATYLYGGKVKNCLTYQTKGHRDWDTHPTFTDTIYGDPLFVDAEHGNFMLKAGSPAIGAATDGSNLGDPHWNDRVLYLEPTSDWKSNGAKFAIYCFGSGSHDAQWAGFMSYDAVTGYYIDTIPAGYPNVIFARINGAKDKPSFGSDTCWNKSPDLEFDERYDLYVITEWNNGRWAASHPTLEDGYYLVGTFGGISQWDLADLSPAKKFAFDSGDQYMLTRNVANGDEFKVRYVEKDVLLYYYPSDGGNYAITQDGNVTIYFKPGTGGDDWYYKCIYVVRNGEPTSLDNVNAADKAVKVLENGQLVIIKDGVRYNVLGTAIR